jgi:zinc/manganese transport system substrate-binding protein
VKTPALIAMLAALLIHPAIAQTSHGRLTVVAAENFYGDIANQLAGPDAKVTSILSNPDQDPHLFEASPSVARSLSEARIVISNGADYDPWMTKLLKAAKTPDRQSIVVADLVHKKPGDNPHLWYDPAYVTATAQSLSAALIAADPAGKAAYEERMRVFTDSLKPLEAKIAGMRGSYTGLEVAATEPVFGYMASALGLRMRNERFQLAVMNSTEPRASDVAAFESDLKKRLVRVLIYNSQASDPAARRLLDIATKSGIPVLGVTETEPTGQTYQSWMMAQLDALDAILAKPAP